MCDGISISWRDLPEVLVEKHRLEERAISRRDGSDREYRFVFAERNPALPVMWNGQLRILRWGNRDRWSKLPRSGWCVKEELEAGGWAFWEPEPVEIPACYGLERGGWYQIRQGVKGVVIRTDRGEPRVTTKRRDSPDN